MGSRTVGAHPASSEWTGMCIASSRWEKVEKMLISALVAGLFILGLFLSMIGSSPRSRGK